MNKLDKKELLNEVSNVLNEEKPDIFTVDSLGLELYDKIFKINFKHVIVYIIFLIASVLMFHKIDHLSFISEDLYINLLAIFTLISSVIAVVFFTLYIYNRKKNNLISLNSLKNSLKVYQLYDLLSFVTIFISIFLWVVIFVVTPVEVSGDSMEHTFHDHDKILVWHIGYNVAVNDVVIIDSKDYLNTEFIIKRVVAVSGDKVEYSTDKETVSVNGVVVVTGVKKHEYQMMMTIKEDNKICYDIGIVPEGYSIVIGDNFGNSTDSRLIGLISNEDILGKCIFRIYPFSQFGIPERK